MLERLKNLSYTIHFIYRFSGVDKDLKEVSKVLEAVGQHNVIGSYGQLDSMPFYEIRGMLKDRGKAVQIYSSKQLAQMLHKDDPVMVCQEVQVDYMKDAIEQVRKYELQLYNKDSQIQKQTSVIQELKES